VAYIYISLAWVITAGVFLATLVQRHRALKSLEPVYQAPGSWPSLAVIIPARNEAQTIGTCLQSLMEQTYPGDRYQVLVVNDGSVDSTAEVVARFALDHPQITLVNAGTLPEGWLGKPHACWVGARGVQSEWLCFLDADTHPGPELLTAAMSTALQRKLEVLSLHPRQVMLGFWERLLMPIPFMSLMLLMDASAINDPQRKQAMANGQFILVQRKAYLAVGGHESIRGEVLEDVRLAQLLKGAGFRLQLIGGDKFIRTRMYSELSPVWQGLARGGSELFGIPLTLLAVLSSLVTAVFPFLYPIWLGSRLNHDPQILLALLPAVLGSLFWYGAHALELKRHHVPCIYLALNPLSMVLIALVNLEGVLRRVAGRRIWKERRI
jgi:chlorobactene glucosyltransferase